MIKFTTVIVCDPMEHKTTPENKVGWHFPMYWPPNKWFYSKPRQRFLNVVICLLLTLAFCTIVGAVVVWIGLIYHVLSAVFQSDPHEALRNLLLGLAALLGAPFLVWRTLIASQQIEINRESHYTALFTKAVEQMGADKVTKRNEFVPKHKLDGDGKFQRDDDLNPIPAARVDGIPLGEWMPIEETQPNIEVRLGAMYALERVAMDSKRDHWPIMETLTAYVRNNCSEPHEKEDVIDSIDEGNHAPPKTIYMSDQADWTVHLPKLRPDLATAIRVIGRRSNNQIENELQQVPQVVFNLAEVSLQRMDASNLNLSGVDFQSARLEGTNFQKTELVGANFLGASMFRTVLENSNSNYANFTRCNLERSDIRDSTFARALLVSAHLAHSSASNCDFTGANLSYADLRKADLAGADFSGANLRGANLSQADLTGANLSAANLRDANLGLANVEDANFDGAKLNGSLFIPNGVPEARNLAETQITEAFISIEVTEQDKQYGSELFVSSLESKWFEWRKKNGLSYYPYAPD